MIEKFEMKSLATIDGGRINAAFERELKRIREDCIDRPGLKRPRQVQLMVTLSPVMDDNGTDLASCNVQFQIKSSLPKRESKVFNMTADRRGDLLFNELSPEDVRQRTIDEPSGPRKVGT